MNPLLSLTYKRTVVSPLGIEPFVFNIVTNIKYFHLNKSHLFEYNSIKITIIKMLDNSIDKLVNMAKYLIAKHNLIDNDNHIDRYIYEMQNDIKDMTKDTLIDHITRYDVNFGFVIVYNVKTNVINEITNRTNIRLSVVEHAYIYKKPKEYLRHIKINEILK
jgi:hypothetical protein